MPAETPTNVSDLYPELDPRRLHAEVAWGNITSGDDALDAVIRGRHFDEATGEIDLERVAAYQRIESELTDSRGKLVVMMVASAEDADNGLVTLMTGRLSDEKVIDASEEQLAVDGYARSEIVKLPNDTPRIFARGLSEKGIALVGHNQYDVGGVVEAGQFDVPKKTELMPAEALVTWLERNIDDEAIRYALYAELYGNAVALGQSESIPSPDVRYAAFVGKERAALTDHAEFYEEVIEVNRGFTRNGLERGNLAPLMAARERFDERYGKLTEAHQDIAWRIPTILTDGRTWPDLEFGDYDWLFKQDISRQLTLLKRESKEMERRLGEIETQGRAVSLMEGVPV